MTPLPLARMSAAAAARQTAVAAALAHAGLLVGGAVPPAAAWLCCSGLALAPLRVRGVRPRLLGDDGRPDAALLLAAVARLEALIERLELALGVELRPEDVLAAPPPGPLLMAGNDGDLVALVAGEGLRPAAPARAPSCVSLRWAAELPGPAVPRERWAQAGCGDLLLGVSRRGWLRPASGGGWRRPVHVEASGNVVVGEAGRVALADSEDEMAAALPAHVPVTVRLDGGVASLADIAALQPGAVLPLAGDPAAPAVTVLAGGVPVAGGTLVAVGDGLGVLIDRLAAR